ncbi:MAG: helix-turn-helix domain-containing protein [Bacteroidaceae bacterium]|nr:helix-turn-helix domain-containing protein [Bacteroidaceae bacterium]
MHIGKEILEQVHASGMTVAGFAERLGYTRTSVYKLMQKSTIDTGTLVRVSRILNYDFFALYSSIISNEEKKVSK